MLLGALSRARDVKHGRLQAHDWERKKPSKKPPSTKPSTSFELATQLVSHGQPAPNLLRRWMHGSAEKGT